MIVKSVDGTSYTIRDWINNEEFSKMSTAQLSMLKITGKVCGWSEVKMGALDEEGNKDKIKITKMMIEEGLMEQYSKLRNEAAQTLIISPSYEDYNQLPRDVTAAAEKQIDTLFAAAQPQPEKDASKK